MSILRCTEAFAVFYGNVPRVLQPGDVVDSDDPVVAGREDKFEPVEAQVSRQSAGFETATSAPGERRSVSTPPRKRAAKAAKKAAPKPKPAAPAGD